MKWNLGLVIVEQRRRDLVYEADGHARKIEWNTSVWRLGMIIYATTFDRNTGAGSLCCINVM